MSSHCDSEIYLPSQKGKTKRKRRNYMPFRPARKRIVCGNDETKNLSFFKVSKRGLISLLKFRGLYYRVEKCRSPKNTLTNKKNHYFMFN